VAVETLGSGSGMEDGTRMAVVDRVSRSVRVHPGRAGWVIAGGSAAVLAVLFAWPATRSALTSADPTNIDPLVAFTLGFGVVGALILSRVGSNALGWVYVGAGGLAGAVTLALLAYARVGLAAHPGSLPGAVAVGWVSSWVGALCFNPLITYGLLLFPDGRLPSRHWRWVAWAAALAIALLAWSYAFAPGPFAIERARANPWALPLPAAVFRVAGGVGWALFLVCCVCAVASLAWRWRRAHGAERAQVQWLLIAAAVFLVGIQIPAPGGPRLLGTIITALFALVIPVAIGIAILRHHLYGVNVIVRRSVVYGLLTVLLLGIYLAAVQLLGHLVSGRAAAPVAAGLVAVLFSPLRHWLQRSVDRLLYGDRGDPYRVLTQLGRNLELPADPAGALETVAGTVASALRVPYVAVALPGDPPDRPTAAQGAPAGSGYQAQLVCQGQDVGQLVVSYRGGTSRFSRSERRLLDDLARQTAVTARSALLFRDLVRSREHLVTTREEERRRLRRDLHDGLGPALAGVAFGLDAARKLLANDPGALMRCSASLRRRPGAASPRSGASPMTCARPRSTSSAWSKRWRSTRCGSVPASGP
jgi:two-component system NarL family sensor kinase